jgi:hypothetical protein
VTTLLEASRALADQLGGFGILTVTEAPESTDPDARRTLISEDLVDEDRDPTSFNDYTVYAAGGVLGGQQKAVRRDMFDGTNGILYTAGLFTAAPAVGQEIEYHARLPRMRHFGEPGVREVINEALARLWFEDELIYAGTASTSYPAPSWLTSNRQLVGIKEGGDTSGGVNPAFSANTATVIHDSGGTVVQLGSPISGPFRIVVRRPQKTWIKTGGTWGDSTAGLVEDDDETLADAEALLVVSTWRAYRALSRRSPDFEIGPWRQEELLWEAKSAAFLQWGIESTTARLGTGASARPSWSKGWQPG